MKKNVKVKNQLPTKNARLIAWVKEIKMLYQPKNAVCFVVPQGAVVRWSVIGGR